MIKIPFLLSFEHGNSRVGFLKFPLSFLPVNIYLPLTIVKSGVKEFFGRVPLIWAVERLSGWAVERWDPLTAHIDVCSKQSLIWAVGEIPKNCGFVLPLILMIAFSKH